MAFDGSEGDEIALVKAAAMTREYRIRTGSRRLGHFFGKNIIDEILAQPNCVGIRLYYGLDTETGAQELIMVGADADQNDMLELVADFSRACPAFCSVENELNSDI